MSDPNAVTRFELYVGNWALKVVGFFVGAILIAAMFGPILGAYLLAVLGIPVQTASFIGVVTLALWWLFWCKVSQAPQATVIYRLFNILLAMLLHSERHRYFMGWDFSQPTREQLHDWNG